MGRPQAAGQAFAAPSSSSLRPARRPSSTSFCAQSNSSDGPVREAWSSIKKEILRDDPRWRHPQQSYLSGVVFKLTPEGKETVLYSFCPRINCSDGQFPEGSLVIDRKGNLYGTVSQGGAQGAGAVFKITSGGKETVLHSFGTEGDGQYPEAGVIFDQIGNLYGTTDGAGPTEPAPY